MSELKLFGQGEMHLRVTAERLADRFGVTIQSQKPSVAYRESIRDAVSGEGGTRSNRAAMASLATSLSRSRPRAAARALPSPRGCMAERCRGSIFLLSKRARATP